MNICKWESGEVFFSNTYKVRTVYGIEECHSNASVLLINLKIIESSALLPVQMLTDNFLDDVMSEWLEVGVRCSMVGVDSSNTSSQASETNSF